MAAVANTNKIKPLEQLSLNVYSLANLLCDWSQNHIAERIFVVACKITKRQIPQENDPS